MYLWMAVGAGSGQLRQVGQDRSGRFAREGLATHVRPSTSEGHKLFIQTLFRVFLDSMKSHLVKIPAMCLWMAVGAGVGRLGQVGKDRSGRSARGRAGYSCVTSNFGRS